MKKSDKLIPCRFDGKDIIVDGDLWDWFLGWHPWVSYCVSSNNNKALFYIGNVPFEALICYESNRIVVTPKTLNWTSRNKADIIVRLFSSWNNEVDSDIYCKHDYFKNDKGEITTIIITYYHTED